MHEPLSPLQLRHLLTTLPKSKRGRVIEALDDATRTALAHDWYLRPSENKGAREEQVPPDGDWSTWLVISGRGWGKTRTGSEWIHERVANGARLIALIAPTAADGRDVIVEGPAGILATARPDQRPRYQSSKRRVTWPNGATATLFSGEEPDRLRGPQHDTVWCDELAAYDDPQKLWDMMQMGLRLGSPQALATTTPRPIEIITTLCADPSTRVTRGNTFDNARNLAPKYLSEIRRIYEGTRIGRQEIYGEILADTEGALWSDALVTSARMPADTSPPDLLRVVVAIDPSVAADGGGDACGIIVVGMAADGRAYVLHDATANQSPAAWASTAARLAEKYGADAIIAESNNGGALVTETLRAHGAKVRISLVHASRGKRARAEPVVALYERGAVCHAPGLAALERELCTWSAASGEASPNRLDALVWGLTALCLRGAGKVASEAEYQF